MVAKRSVICPLKFEGNTRPVVQVIEDASGEVLYTLRVHGSFQPPVYSEGSHTIKIGADKPDAKTLGGLQPKAKQQAGSKTIRL
jgi:hypothetical protein